MFSDLDKLKSKYEEQRISSSEDLWNKLEEKLDESPVKQKKDIWWIKYAAIVILFVSLGFVLLWDKHSTKADEKINVVKTENKEIEIKPEQVEIKNLAISTDNIVIKTQISKKTIVNNTIKPQKESIEESPIVSTYVAPVSEINIQKSELPSTLEIQKPNPVIAQNKEAKYISSSELLMGVEIDKARKENIHNGKKLGIINLSKLKPQSIRIFGIAVKGDSVITK